MSDWTAGALEGLSATLLIVSTMFVCLRFYARKTQQAKVLADDWLMLVALITFLGCCICIWIGIHFWAFGISSYVLTPEQDQAADKVSFLIQISLFVLSYLNLGCIKASALMFYKRIFCVPGPTMRTLKFLIYTTLILVAAWVIAFEFLVGFQCGTHFTALWKPTHNEYCVYTYPSLYGLVISDVILDIWVLILPIYWIMRLHTSPSKKLGIIGLFLLALVGLAGSLARMAEFVRVYNLGPVQAEHSDPRKIDSRLGFFFILESGMSMIAINLPVVAFIFFRLAPHALVQAARNLSSSLASLVPKRSQGSRGSRGKHSLEDGDDSVVSHELTNSRDGTSETYVMRDNSKSDLPNYPNRIMVSNSTEVSRAEREQV